MKNSLHLNRLSILLIFFLTTVANGQLVLYEGFDYSLPGYIGGNTGSAGSTSNNWTTHSVTAGQTTTIDLYSGSLNYLGSQNPIGHKVLLPGTNTPVSRDVNRAITTASTVIYYSTLINVLDNTQLGTTGDYFMCIGQTAGTTVTILGARLGIKSVNTGANYRLLIQNTSGTGSNYTEFATDLNFGTSYLVVVKYDRSGSPTIANLWVNPSPLGSTEPAGSVSNSSSASSFSAFASICLRNGSATPKVEIDEIRVGESFASVTPVDVAAPVASFNPSNSAVGVAIDVTPVISFDEPILKSDGSPVSDGDLATLVTFRKTDASGDPVSFSATIDASKKVITVTPTASLLNGQLYYLAVGPVKDGSGFTSLTQTGTFTTISAATPTVTLTYPVGGETFYAGDVTTFTWTSANITNVKIQAWVISQARTWDWYSVTESTPAATGSFGFTVPTDLTYGTLYKIRISDAGNPAVYSESAAFTCIPVLTSLTELKASCIVNDIVKISSETTVTYIRTANRNQKFIQDAGAGLLIDDASAVLTTPLTVGDNIKNLEGKLGEFNGQFQIVPTKSSVVIASTGNTVTIPSMTLSEFLTNFNSIESMLVKITNVTFVDANGTATFAANTGYNITDGTNTAKFFTFKAGEVDDIIGKVIPSGSYNITGLVQEYTPNFEISSRSWADLESVTVGMEELSDSRQIRLYPVPASSVLNISNVPDLKSIEILDVTGRVVRTINSSTDELLQIPVNSLSRGMYMIRFNTANGKVVKRFVKS